MPDLDRCQVVSLGSRPQETQPKAHGSGGRERGPSCQMWESHLPEILIQDPRSPNSSSNHQVFCSKQLSFFSHIVCAERSPNGPAIETINSMTKKMMMMMMMMMMMND